MVAVWGVGCVRGYLVCIDHHACTNLRRLFQLEPQSFPDVHRARELLCGLLTSDDDSILSNAVTVFSRIIRCLTPANLVQFVTDDVAKALVTLATSCLDAYRDKARGGASGGAPSTRADLATSARVIGMLRSLVTSTDTCRDRVLEVRCLPRC